MPPAWAPHLGDEHILPEDVYGDEAAMVQCKGHGDLGITGISRLGTVWPHKVYKQHGLPPLRRSQASNPVQAAHPKQGHDDGSGDCPAENAGPVCCPIRLAAQRVKRAPHPKEEVPQEVEQLR